MAPLQPPYSPDVQASFDAIMPPGAAPLTLFRVLAAHPRAWAKLRGASMLDPGPLSLREREIVIDRACARAGCEYEWGVHVTAFGGRAGLTPEMTLATTQVPSPRGVWSEAEEALIDTVDALHDRARLNSREFRRLRAHYDEDQVLEIVMLAGLYRTIACLANSLDLPPEPAAARFPGTAA